jgi:hypothetical protein
MAALRFLLTASCVLACSLRARADQVTLVDEAYTHSAMNTSDSHYRVTPKPGTPKDWTKPVNYAGGSVHMLLEVKTKPGDAQTRFQVCFEKGSNAACAVQSPTYTKPTQARALEWDDPVSNFWNGSTMNWASGVDKIALILKDNNNGKPQGDPKFVPTELHVVVTLVSAGSKYDPASTSSPDAGVVDAGSDAGRADAGPSAQDAGRAQDAGEVEAPPAHDAAVGAHDAAAAPSRDATVVPDARVAPDAALAADTDTAEDPAMAGGDDGCALATGDPSGWLAMLLALARARRRAGPRG